MALPRIIMTAAKLAGQYGPAIVAYVKANPEAAKKVSDAVKKVAVRADATPPEIATTIEGLREQVEYLRDSADDKVESERAEAWMRELDHLDRAVGLMQDGASRSTIKRLAERVATVRDDVLEAFLTEQAEDAAKAKRLRDR